MEPYAVFQVLQMLLRLLAYTFVGKAVLALIAGPGHRENPVWRFLDAVTRPVWRLTRRLAPGFVGDRAVAPLSVALLLLANLGLYVLFHTQGWITTRAIGGG